MDRKTLPSRHSIRLREYDYSQNSAYFVTICAIGRQCLFGAIQGGVFCPAPVGREVESAWHDLPSHTSGLLLDARVLMPNHVHGILILPGRVNGGSQAGTASRCPQPASLGTVIGGLKSAVSRRVAAERLTSIRPLWQRNYFERVIRNEQELDAIRQYIVDNPAR